MIDDIMKEYNDNVGKYIDNTVGQVIAILMLVDRIDTLNRKLGAIERVLITRM